MEAALFTTDSEPDIVPALHFPRLTLVKTDEELDLRSEGARNEDAGRYCSIIEWAGLALATGQTAKWVGPRESSAYTLPRLAAYLAANGVTYHDVDDTWAWGHT